MRSLKWMLLVCGVLTIGLADTEEGQAQRYRRQYYSSWAWHRSYYYRGYYYTVDPADTTYTYQYVIYYPSRPRYYYYYNPRRRLYWGRYDVDAKGYSMLEEKDRKGEVSDIAEEAFPKPAQMPVIPDAKDGIRMEPPPLDVPKEAPPQK